jgi:hypothetical protein
VKRKTSPATARLLGFFASVANLTHVSAMNMVITHQQAINSKHPIELHRKTIEIH